MLRNSLVHAVSKVLMPRKASDNPHGVRPSGYPRLPQPSNYSNPYLGRSRSITIYPSLFVKLLKAISICAKGTPTFLNTAESVKSLYKRDTGNFVAKCSKIALAILDYPQRSRNQSGSPYVWHSRRPISPALIFCLKYSMEIYCQKSRFKSIKIVLIRFKPSKIAARLS